VTRLKGPLEAIFTNVSDLKPFKNVQRQLQKKELS